MQNLILTISKRVLCTSQFQKIRSFSILFVWGVLFFHIPLSGQINVTVPECATCPGSGGSSSSTIAVASKMGIFPYKVEEIAGNDYGTRVLRTENGVVFGWGWNGYGVTGSPDLLGRSNPLVTSPSRIDLPAGVKAVDIAVGGGNIMAIGDNGKLYGSGSRASFWGAGAYAGVAVNTGVFSEIPLPTGATSVLYVAASPDWFSSTVIIDDLGRAWFTGQDPNQTPNPNPSGYTPNNTTTWSQIQAPNTSVTFTNLWSFGLSDHVYNSHNNYVFEGSDGKYYTFGINMYGAFASTTYSSETTSESYEFLGGVTIRSHDDPLVEMAMPAGKTFVKFDGDHGIHMALADDGTLYAWSTRTINWFKYADGSTSSVLPKEVALPTGGPLNVSPTKVTAMCPLMFQCDDGVLYSGPNVGGDSRTYDGLEYTANGYRIKMGPQFAYTEIHHRYEETWDMVELLTTEGHLVGYGDPHFDRTFGPLGPMVSGEDNNNSMPYFLTDPRWDPNNPRPTE